MRKNLFKTDMEALNMDCLKRPFILTQTIFKELRLKNELQWHILKIAMIIRYNITTIVLVTNAF